MTPQEFYRTYKPKAMFVQQRTGLNYLAQLTQAALESGWGQYAPGNNFFGVKDTDGVNGNEQLITTTEVLATDKAKFPVILSIKKVGTLFYYTVKDYFRKYDTAEQCFMDHAQFFIDNARYRVAWAYREDPERFLREVAKAGYATAPDYEKQLISTLNWFVNYSKLNP